MERQDLTPTPDVDASRPSIGFPLGTALLLIVIFGLSGFLSFCYHWDKLRSFFSGDETDRETDIHSVPSKHTSMYPEQIHQSLPVIMPGDRIPKFIALPCPCEAPRPEKISVSVDVQIASSPPQPTLVHNQMGQSDVYYNS